MFTVEEEKKIRERLEHEGPKQWYHSVEAVPGSEIFTPGSLTTIDYGQILTQCNLSPEWFSGKRVLDIGTYSGAFAFYLEEQGADVLAIDVQDPDATGFSLLRELRASKVEFARASVYDLNFEDHGLFDLVAFFGVFYHLKHPILALERINSVLKSSNALLLGAGTGCDTWIHDDNVDCSTGVNCTAIKRDIVNNPQAMTAECLNDLAISAFASDHYLDDRTNWFIPNSRCIDGWLKRTGFNVMKLLRDESHLPRKWNKTGIQRSSITFLAAKVGEPESEYGMRDYQWVYNDTFQNDRFHYFRIPVESEVQRLRSRIKELETELKKLKRST